MARAFSARLRPPPAIPGGLQGTIEFEIQNVVGLGGSVTMEIDVENMEASVTHVTGANGAGYRYAADGAYAVFVGEGSDPDVLNPPIEFPGYDPEFGEEVYGLHCGYGFIV